MDKKSPLKIYGLLGFPVRHSLSPAMHNAAFRALNLPAEYRLFEVKPEDLEDFLLKDVPINDINGKPTSSKYIAGFNITVPHKIKAREIMEREYPYDQDAKSINRDLYYVQLSGAVNTVKRETTELKYWNTDAEGFLKSLEKDLEFETKDKKVLVIGCGGAGRAIIAALSWGQLRVDKIYITDIKEEAIDSAKRHFSQFSRLKNMIEFITTCDVPQYIKECHLLINASPVGMREEDGPIIDKALLHKGLFVYDVVYNRETQLVKDAKSFGLQVVNGLGMLLYQGVLSFECWTEQKVRKELVDVMRKSLEEALIKRW